MAYSPKTPPKYFSGTRKHPALPPPTSLAIEVLETSTPHHSFQRTPTKTPPFAGRFPALTPSSTRIKHSKPLTPHRQQETSFQFTAKGRNKSVTNTARSGLTPYKPRAAQQANRGKTSEKLLTPKAGRAEELRRTGKLREVVTRKESGGAGDMYKEHLFQTFQALGVVKTFPELSEEELKRCEVRLERKEGCAGKKTIVFDLDETLVHCSDGDTEVPPDVDLPVVFPTGEEVCASLHIRPYVHACLQAASDLFEVIVFTASHRCYADVVLDYLDPENRLISHRLYRENCIVVQGLYIKDLRILRDRDLAHTVIVDNAVYSFGYQLDNGIPIVTWNDDKADKELLNLIDYMKVLAGTEDVRLVNRETFRLFSFFEDYMREVKAQMKARKVRRHRRVD